MDHTNAQPQTPGRRNVLALLAGSVLATLGLARDARPAAAAAATVLLGTANKATVSTSITTTVGTGLDAKGAAYGAYGTAIGTTTTAMGVSGTAKATSGYGVMSNGRLGVTGPIEMAVVTIASYAGPAPLRAYLYVKTNAKVTELRVKFPSGVDVSITSA